MTENDTGLFATAEGAQREIERSKAMTKAT